MFLWHITIFPVYIYNHLIFYLKQLALTYALVLCVVGTTNPHSISKWFPLMTAFAEVAKGMCKFQTENIDLMQNSVNDYMVLEENIYCSL